MQKNEVSFDAIAVLGGIDMYGKVVAVETRKGYIDRDCFIQFLKGLRDQPRPLYLFLDNLRMHYCDDV